MEKRELDVLQGVHIDMSKLERRYVTIEMEGKPFKVRVLVYGKKEENKKTLCMTHGYLGNSTVWGHMLNILAEHYRLVLFDNGSFGLNTRLEKTVATESPEAAEEWFRDWIVKVFDAMTEEAIVPDKFYCASHSIGGWLTCQYASQRPERIEGLFLMSPAGTDPYDEATWDPYSIKDPNDLRCLLKREKVDKIIKNINTLRHPL